MANVKLGNNTLAGVNTVRLQKANVAGEYVSFGLGAAPAGLWCLSGVNVASSTNSNIGGCLVFGIYFGRHILYLLVKNGITFDDIEAQDWLLKCGD